MALNTEIKLVNYQFYSGEFEAQGICIVEDDVYFNYITRKDI
jgi:hypothetical protein